MFRPITFVLSGTCALWLLANAPLIAEDGKWVRGSLHGKPTPVWGHTEGLQIGLAPLRGPRGLLRVDCALSRSS